jgi:mannose/fructose/N-acetylgalactosamine-specific phosphotransferase system component IIB
MAITTADGWFAAAKQRIILQKASVTATSLQPMSTLAVAGNPGAGSLAIGNTTTGVVPTQAAAGFPTLRAFGGAAVGYLASAVYRGSVAGGAILYDRLWHAGSVSLLALTTTAFASQPAITQRLPGGNDFSNMEILLEIAAAVSATATTVTVTYTNEAGVAGRVTNAATLTSFIANRLVPMTLQAGDKGVQKIESVIVGGVVATTGTFNVVLARNMAAFDIRVANALDAQGWDLTGSPQVFADAALFLAAQPDGGSTPVCTLNLSIING